MPLNALQTQNVNAVVAFLRQIQAQCPNPEIAATITRITDAMANGKLSADDAAVTADAQASGDPDPISWQATTNSNGTFIRPTYFGAGPFDLAGHCDRDAYPFVILLSLLVHELYHQAGVTHPDTYKATADVLDAIFKCLQSHTPLCEKFMSELKARSDDERASFNLPTASNQGQRVKTAVGVGVGAVGGVALVKTFATAGTLMAGPVGTIVGALVGAGVGWAISKLF